MTRYPLAVSLLMAGAMVYGASVLRAQESGCRTGGKAAADAYVLSNPFYATFFGDLREYVAENASHFREGGDATRCLAALSQVFLDAAFRMYDPSEQKTRDEINLELDKVGIPHGPPQSSGSAEALNASARLARLARALPAAVDGDWDPYATPVNDIDTLQIQAEQLLRMFLQNPDVAAAIAQAAPLIRQAAVLEHSTVQRHAVALAGKSD
jgi:hypothetical protein